MIKCRGIFQKTLKLCNVCRKKCNVRFLLCKQQLTMKLLSRHHISNVTTRLSQLLDQV